MRPDLSLRELASQALTAREGELGLVISNDPLVGTTIAGHHILSPIGRGGMGAVYRARSEALDREVALKVMLPELSGNQEFRQRFIREAQSGLEHPNIVPILDAGDEQGVLYIAMEYVDGFDLKTLVSGEGKLIPTRCVGITQRAAAALDHAHENGIVHRDVKPQNILVRTEDGSGRADSVFLTDFGLVKRISSQSSFTTSAYLMGTLHYMAPEQIEGKPLDGRTDVYALGCVLFECLTGSVPFDKDSEVAVLWSHMHDPPPSAVAKEPLLPEAVDVILAKAMAKDPDDRFLTAGEFAGAFAQEFGTSGGRVRSVWGPGQISASGKRSRPLQRELAARAAAKAPPPPAPAAPHTKGFLVGIAAAFALFGFWFGFGDADRRAAIGDFVGDVADVASLGGDDDAEQIAQGEDRADSALGQRPASRGSDGKPDDLVRLPQGTDVVTKVSNGSGKEVTGDQLPVPPGPKATTRTAQIPSRIVFGSSMADSKEGGGEAIFSMKPDGTDVRMIMNSANNDYDPVWSPDGRQLAFTAGYRIYVMKPDGTGIRVLSPAEGWARNPTWSPDGKNIAFEYSATADQTRDTDQGWGIAAVTVADPRVVRILTPLAGADHDPAWSPDGQSIVFTSLRNDASGDLFVMNFDGSDVVTFAGGPGAQRQAAWSPSSDAIAYSAQTSNASGFDIYIKKIADDTTRKVTSLRRAFGPTFSPDGRFLAFVGGYTAVDRKYEGLFLMRIPVRGGEEKRLSRAASWTNAPDWR